MDSIELTPPRPAHPADAAEFARLMHRLTNAGKATLTPTRTTEKVELSATDSAQPVKAEPSKPKGAH